MQIYTLFGTLQNKLPYFLYFFFLHIFLFGKIIILPYYIIISHNLPHSHNISRSTRQKITFSEEKITKKEVLRKNITNFKVQIV